MQLAVSSKLSCSKQDEPGVIVIPHRGSQSGDRKSYLLFHKPLGLVVDKDKIQTSGKVGYIDYGLI